MLRSGTRCRFRGGAPIGDRAARLVMLPAESYVMHTLAEMIEWFDWYVKKGDVAGPGSD